jgi:putative spermidine/putrescine transport system permease protein
MTQRADLAPPAGTRGPARRAPAARRLLRWAVLGVLGAFFLLPLVAMLDFSTRGAGGHRTAQAWTAISGDHELIHSISVSLELAVLTVAMMLTVLVPTMAWVHLRVPRARRVVEFCCLLPLTIPAIVLVVGIAPIYAWVTYLLGDSPLTLTFVYTVLVLPYAYRAIDGGLRSNDLITLSDAARSLGCSWPGVILRVVVPNIRNALLAAGLLSVALVLGEFTISSLLSFNTLQVEINLLGKRNAAESVAVSLAALSFAFVLLFLLSFAGQRRRGEQHGRLAKSPTTQEKIS